MSTKWIKRGVGLAVIVVVGAATFYFFTPQPVDVDIAEVDSDTVEFQAEEEPVAVAAANSDGPLAIVDAIYSQIEDGEEPVGVSDAYFSEGLLELWRAVDAGSKNGVKTAIGFEIFTDAKDDESIESVSTQIYSDVYVIVNFLVVPDGHSAAAGYKNFFKYNFADTADGWKIDDIDWGRSKKTLRGMLKEIIEVQKLG